MSMKVFGAVTAIALLATAANAADLPVRMTTKAPPAPPAPVPTWTACYIGGNVGGGWSHTQVNDEISGVSLATLNASAVVGGGQVGCDLQFGGNWVIGVQGMYDASGLKQSTTSAALAPASLNGSIPWFGTVTGRLGYAVAPGWLVYGKGGGAWTHVDANITFAGLNLSSGSFGQSGWTAGGGVEWKVAPNWSVFAEYDYLGFTNKTVTLTGVATNIGTVEQNVQALLVGVNLRFGGPAY